MIEKLDISNEIELLELMNKHNLSKMFKKHEDKINEIIDYINNQELSQDQNKSLYKDYKKIMNEVNED